MRVLYPAFLSLLLGVVLASPVRASCDFDGPLDELMGHLRHAAYSGEVLTRRQAADLGRMAGAIKGNSIANQLDKYGLSNQMPHIDRLVTETRRIANQGQVRSIPTLQRQVRSVDRVIEKACDQQPKGFFANLTTDLRTRLTGATAGQSAGSNGSFAGSGKGSLLILGGIIGIAVGCVALLFALRYAYAWVFSIIYNRKSCRIRVALELETEIIDGFVTIIGMKGCRFKPINSGAFERLVRLIDVLHISTDGHLVVGKHRIPAYVFGLYDQFSVLYFEEQMQRSLLANLLKASSVSPQIVPKATPRRNVSRRRVKVSRIAPAVQP